MASILANSPESRKKNLERNLERALHSALVWACPEQTWGGVGYMLIQQDIVKAGLWTVDWTVDWTRLDL